MKENVESSAVIGRAFLGEKGMTDKNGILYGIGVGPGEPGLMTIKALHTIRSCDVILLPAASKEECYAYKIAHEVCPEIEEKSLVCTFSNDPG